MVCFIARRIDGEIVNGTLTDLGACYVAEIEIEGKKFYSIVDANLADLDGDPAAYRCKKDTQRMSDEGFELMEVK